MEQPDKFTFHIPHSNGTEREVSVSGGASLFLLGPNGAGKSTLLQHINSQFPGKARRIFAHRQTWFHSGAPSLSAADRVNAGQNIAHHDANTRARWSDDFSHQRSMIAIFDLIDAENVRARRIAEAVDASKSDLLNALKAVHAPLKVINNLLSLASIPVELKIGERGEVLATKGGSDPFSIAELSDGERNAILIATDVLTAGQGTLLLIDEPERHLHRAIISPLLSALFAKRSDCPFVISTHDVSLPIDNPNASIVLLRSCKYAARAPQSWDFDLVFSQNEIDEDLKRDILGARRRILFVEGNESSLDRSLYRILFPNVSIIAKQNCREVIRATTGIRSSDAMHWIEAWGLIDRDQRTKTEVDNLWEKGIFSLPYYSVESIYFHPYLMRRVASRQGALIQADPQTMADAATDAALMSIERDKDRLCKRLTDRHIRDAMVGNLSVALDSATRETIKLEIDRNELITREETIFQEYSAKRDLGLLIGRYPVRETSALGEIAKKLRFSSKTDYVAAVRTTLLEDEEAIIFIRGLFADLADKLHDIG